MINHTEQNFLGCKNHVDKSLNANVRKFPQDQKFWRSKICWIQYDIKNLEKMSFEDNVLGLKVKGQKEQNSYIEKMVGEQKLWGRNSWAKNFSC